MSLAKRTFMAFVAGLWVMGFMVPGKSGRGFYFFEITPRSKAPLTAGELLRRVGEYPVEGDNDGSWRGVASREFAKDLARMKWTWNGQISWEDGPAPAIANPAP